MALHATILYASLFTLMYLYLSAEVSRLRAKYEVGLGDGGNMDLLKAIRIHGNFSEYVPLFLFLLFLSELLGGRSWLLHTLGGLLLIGRILHVAGIRKTPGPSLYRFFGIIITWTVLLVLALFCLISVF